MSVDADRPETPDQWRNQLLRELAHCVYEIAPPDMQRRIARIVDNWDRSIRREEHENEK